MCVHTQFPCTYNMYLSEDYNSIQAYNIYENILLTKKICSSLSFVLNPIAEIITIFFLCGQLRGGEIKNDVYHNFSSFFLFLLLYSFYHVPTYFKNISREKKIKLKKKKRVSS